MIRTALIAVTSVVLAAPLIAQAPAQPPQSRADRFMRNCEDGWGDRDRERFCEVRDVTLRPPANRLVVDGHQNGSIRLHGWDRGEVLVRALIQTWGDSRDEAQDLARQLRIETDGDRIRSDGPSTRRRSGWAVSYEVWMPRKTNVDAETQNGGITAEGIEGRLYLDAVNGGITLRDVAGDVRAETTNGGATAVLSGTTWRGGSLDLSTTNGSVTLEIPRGYNAELETGTVNGGMNIDFPVTVRGTIGRRLTTRLGTGGPRIRAVTTNGSVRIRETR